MPTLLSVQIEQFRCFQSAARSLGTPEARFVYLSSLVSDKALVLQVAQTFLWKLRKKGYDPELLSLAYDESEWIVLSAGFHYLEALVSWRVVRGADEHQEYQSLVNWWAHQAVFEYQDHYRRTHLRSRGVNPETGEREGYVVPLTRVDDSGEEVSLPLADERENPVRRTERAQRDESFYRLLKTTKDREAAIWLATWLKEDVLDDDLVYEDAQGALKLRWRHRAQQEYAAVLAVTTRTMRNRTARVEAMLEALRQQCRS